MKEPKEPIIDSAPEMVVVKYYIEDIILTASYPEYSFDALSDTDKKIFELAFMRFLNAIIIGELAEKKDIQIVTSLEGVSITLAMPGEPILELTNIAGDFILFGSEQDVAEYNDRINNQ